jgi:tripartite-type tricarboxylate transporter receptor subunit TctC
VQGDRIHASDVGRTRLPAVLGLIVLCAAAFIAGAASAQSYPARTIRVVVPFAPGGATDVVFRILAPRMFEGSGQAVVIDNRPGGAATIGMDLVAKSRPDGYTLGVANVSFGVNPFLMSRMPFDTEKDLLPVSLVVQVPLVLVIHPSVPVRSVKALIAFAKARPGSLTYGSAGNASASHLSMELFNYLTGNKMIHVPFKGGGPARISLISGETAIQFATIPAMMPHFREGRLIPLGVSTLERDPTLPDLPTIAEMGVAGFEVAEWQGVVVPAGTPTEIVARLHQEIVKVLAHPEVKDRLAANGARPVGSTPAEFEAFIRKEMAVWSKVIRTAGIRIE